MGADADGSGRPLGRKERLAAALRANLARRKAQSRGRRTDEPSIDRTTDPIHATDTVPFHEDEASGE